VLDVILTLPFSPLEEMWTEDALFFVKLIFNSIIIVLFIAFVFIAWFAMSFLISLLIKSEMNRFDAVIEIFMSPVTIMKKILRKGRQ